MKRPVVLDPLPAGYYPASSAVTHVGRLGVLRYPAVVEREWDAQE